MKISVFILILLLFFLSIICPNNSMILDNFHCKVATCRDFYYVNDDSFLIN